MSGDLTHSFQPVNSTLNYWKSVYNKREEAILIFARGSNAKNVISVKGWNVELTTLMSGIVSVPATQVIFVTSSPIEDATWINDFQQLNPQFREDQFVQCQMVEQLWSLISRSTHVYTDRYHPGVVAYLHHKPVTILKYDEEQTKLVGLVQLMSTKSPDKIREEHNPKAFQLLRDTLRQLKARGKDTVPFEKTKEDAFTPYIEQPHAIVVGLPKSGTTSVYHFFSCSGYRTTHYCCCGTKAIEYPCEGGKLLSQQLRENLDAGRNLWHGTGNKAVHAQLDGESPTETYFLPQHYNLPALHESAPNASWILPLRSAASWKKSVQNWLDMGDRLRVVYQRYNPSKEFDLELFYDEHTALIRDFCKKYRPQLCVEVNINDSDTGKHLLKHFRNAIPSCWGRHNAGPFFQTLPPKL